MSLSATITFSRVLPAEAGIRSHRWVLYIVTTCLKLRQTNPVLQKQRGVALWSSGLRCECENLELVELKTGEAEHITGILSTLVFPYDDSGFEHQAAPESRVRQQTGIATVPMKS
jgi:hypothetical protein